jgi:hypothetical protein
LKDIKRLLGVYPPLNTADAEQAVRNYLLAVDDYTAADVEAAVNTFIKGTAPGVNPSFLPPPPAVGAECRRQMNLRCDREQRERNFRPKLPPPDIERDEASQARVKELMERTARGLRTPDSDDPVARHKRQLDKTNARFDQERGYSVGDPDAEWDAA